MFAGIQSVPQSEVEKRFLRLPRHLLTGVSPLRLVVGVEDTNNLLFLDIRHRFGVVSCAKMAAGSFIWADNLVVFIVFTREKGAKLWLAH
jgi:hypothetical protein